jgi:hypothetical protein
MTLTKFINGPFYFPVDGVDSGSKEPMTKDDIIDFLGDDDDEETEQIDLDDKKDDKKKDKSDDKKDDDEEIEEEDTKDSKKKDKSKSDSEDEEDSEEDEDKDDLSELEEELDELDEEPDDEKLELTTPVSRREILKKYPNLFKDFPYMEKAYYREQQFTKYFPNPADAKAVVEKADVLDKFENDLAQGDITKALKAVQTNKKAFGKMVDKYMSALNDVDSKAYQHIYGNMVKHVIMSMVKRGQASKDDSLIESAEALNKFIFGSDQFEHPTMYGDTKDDEKDTTEDAVKKVKQEALESKFKGSVDDLTERVRKIFKSTIKTNIDKKEQMTDWARNVASDQALTTLENLMNRDTRFKSLIDRLWEKAIETDFSKDSMDRLKRAFTSKAQTLLPSVLKKVRTDALKGSGKKSAKAKEDIEDDDTDTTNRNDKRERNRSSRTPDKSAKNKIPANMSSLEYLMSDD